MGPLPATLLLQPLTNTTSICRFRPFAFDGAPTQWGPALDQQPMGYIEGAKAYKRLLGQLHPCVCRAPNHPASGRRALLHRATDWVGMGGGQGGIQAGVCIAPLAPGGNGCLAGGYTGWPQGLGGHNAHRVGATNNAIVAAFDTYTLSLAQCKP